MPETATQTGVRELTFGEAIREALAEEMRRDSRVCIIGEDVEIRLEFGATQPFVRVGKHHAIAAVPLIEQHGEVARRR